MKKMKNIKHIASLIGIMSLSIMISLQVKAQVGVGTDSPSSKAILHMESSDKGLIIPKMTNGQMDAMTIGGNPETGTLIYNTDVNEIFAFKNGKWYSMTPFQRERSSNITKDTIIPATTSAGNPLKVTSLHATSGFGITPLGGIIMWSGVGSTVPDGWALCDGRSSNGYKTPDLRGRFIVGHEPNSPAYNQPGNLSTKGTAVGDIGGDSVVTLTTAQMPSHDHSGNTGYDGGHQHTFKDRFMLEETSVTSDYSWETRSELIPHSETNIRGDNGNDKDNERFLYVHRDTEPHAYTFTVRPQVSHILGTIPAITYDIKNGNHRHTISAQGGGQAHENRPPYYALAFIMRVK